MRHRPRLGLLLFLTGLFIVHSVENNASADPSAPDLAAEAGIQFELGIEMYREGQYAQALNHLLASNRLAPNKNVMFNIARCFHKMKRYEHAYNYYRQYLKQETRKRWQRRARQALNRIRGKVALVTVRSTPPGAKVYIDRKNLGVRGVTPLTRAVSVGSHSIIVEQPGHHDTTFRRVIARRGREAIRTATLDKIYGTIDVSGTPHGAEIRLDSVESQVVGHVPATVKAPAGPHLVIVTVPRRQTVQKLVSVRGGERVGVKFKMRFGSVIVESRPSGAEVYVDDRLIGLTPFRVPYLRAGNHRVRISADGHRSYDREVTVVPGATKRIQATLRLRREVTAASRTIESAEDAPASVTLISREEIRAFRYQNLYDALGGTRGVVQTNDLTYSFIGFRGVDRVDGFGNRVLSLVDGHRINDDWSGATVWGYDARSDLLDVERIEVVRGPGSVVYGSNAVSGVINVVTNGADTMLRPHASVATDGVRQSRIRLGGGKLLGEHSGLWLTLGGTVSQGADFYFPEYDDGQDDGTAADADGFRSLWLNGKAWHKHWTLQASYVLPRKRIPTGAFDTLLGDSRAYAEDRRGYIDVAWQRKLKRAELSARGYLDIYQFRGQYPYTPDVGGLVRERWDGVWGGVEPRAQVQLTRWLQVAGGAEARRELYSDWFGQDDESSFQDSAPTLSSLGAFASARITPSKKLALWLGARVDRYSILARDALPDGDLNTTNSALSPRVAAVVRPVPASTLKLIAGTAFRAPSVYEYLITDGGISLLPALELSPERARTFEAEYRHEFYSDWSITVASYLNEITNLIDGVDVESPIPDDPDNIAFRFANSDRKLKTFGAEAEIGREWSNGWMLIASYSLQRVRRGSPFRDRDKNGESTKLTNSPEHQVAFKAAFPIAKQRTLANRFRIESGRVTQAGTRTRPILLWDVVVSGEITKRHLSYGFGIRNLLDWRHSYPGGSDLRQNALPQRGRTFFLELTAGY